MKKLFLNLVWLYVIIPEKVTESQIWKVSKEILNFSNLIERPSGMFLKKIEPITKIFICFWLLLCLTTGNILFTFFLTGFIGWCVLVWLGIVLEKTKKI